MEGLKSVPGEDGVTAKCVGSCEFRVRPLTRVLREEIVKCSCLPIPVSSKGGQSADLVVLPIGVSGVESRG